MIRFTTLARAAVLATAFLGSAAFADPMPLTSFLTAADPLQKGRLSRNSIPQDFGMDEAYPGFINPTLSYHFHAYTFNTGLTPYITISIDSLSANTFVAAYQSAYFVTNAGATWLGDPGTSGNYFSGTDPLSFSFLAAVNSTIVLIVNETTPNAGLGATMPYTLYAQVIPEPETLALLAAPLAALAFSRRRKAVPIAA
jgi:hypothetical protein